MSCLRRWMFCLGSALLSGVAAGQAVQPNRLPVGEATSAPSLGISYVPHTPVSFATHAEFSNWGYAWGLPDGAFGAIPAGGNTYTFYGTGSSSSKCTGTPNVRVGVFTFSGTLDQVTASTCREVFGLGAGPGWLFDRDYAGGGQVVRFVGSGTSGWLMSFHAEMHWQNLQNPPSFFCSGVPCFYSSVGLAVSTDNGQRFTVVGEIFQPSRPMSVFMGGANNMPVGYGSLVVADANGKHLDNPPPDPSVAYYYLFFSDQFPGSPGACANYNCLGVERARYTDVVSAALSGDPHKVATVFHKYNPASPDPWTQPSTSDTPDNSGTAGTYGPLWTDEPAYDPNVIYDRTFDLYLAAYPTNGVVKIRASTDLIHWSEPIGPAIADPGRAIIYPMLVGETGDPTIAGYSPRLYYSSFGAFPDWSTSVFDYVHSISSGSRGGWRNTERCYRLPKDLKSLVSREDAKNAKGSPSFSASSRLRVSILRAKRSHLSQESRGSG